MSAAGAGRLRPAHFYCLLAGTGDAVTGLLLVAAPMFTLGLMRISEVPYELVYLRFIGAFVAGVGLSYLLPFVYRERRRRDSKLGVVLEVTALIRLCIALFTGWAITSGSLPGGWFSVLATDLVLAVVQILMVKRRVFASESGTESAG